MHKTAFKQTFSRFNLGSATVQWWSDLGHKSNEMFIFSDNSSIHNKSECFSRYQQITRSPERQIDGRQCVGSREYGGNTDVPLLHFGHDASATVNQKLYRIGIRYHETIASAHELCYFQLTCTVCVSIQRRRVQAYYTLPVTPRA